MLRFAPLKVAAILSFPRKRESTYFWSDVDPRLRGGDNNGDFHLLGWAAGPRTLSMAALTLSFYGNLLHQCINGCNDGLE